MSFFVWELAVKVSLRKLRLALAVKQYVPYHVAANGFIQLPIDFSHICQVETLPWHHRDPFDRLLIAQAQIQDLPLVSADARFDRYGIPRIGNSLRSPNAAKRNPATSP